MIEVLLVLGQCICVIGLIYAALLATVSVDWLEDLPADSLKCDSLARSVADAVQPGDAGETCARSGR